MVCQICGQYIVQDFVQPEVAALVHRFMKHQPPAAQGLATVGLTFVSVWVLWRTVMAMIRSH